MKNGKYSRKQRRSHKRFAVVLVSLVLLCMMAIGTTLAYLVAEDKPVMNLFNPSEVTSKVNEESFDGSEKKNVTIQNTGDISAFIRADIVVTWMDKDGNVLYEVPELDEDYTIQLNTTDWVEKNGFYYYKHEVKAGDSTSNLINSATAKTGNGEFFVSIEILSSAIQSIGVDAKGNKPIELAWGVDIAGGNVSDATISK